MNGLDNEAITLIYVKECRLLFEFAKASKYFIYRKHSSPLLKNNATRGVCHGSLLLKLNKWEETRL